MLASSPEPGVFRPDPDLDGPDPLPSLVARSMDAVGAEQQIGAGIAHLARLGFLSITSSNCILVNAGRGRRSSATATKAEAARSNGSLGGRPRKGETDEAYAARRQAARNQGSLMLPLGGGTGAAAYGDPLAGEQLAQQLRSTIRLAGGPDEETQETQLVTQAETQGETQLQTQPVLSVGFAEPAVTLPVTVVGVVVEDEGSTVREEEPKAYLPPPPPLPPREQTQTQPKPETQAPPNTETQAHEPKPVPPISPIANELARKAGLKWSWPEEVARVAPRVFQTLIDERWTPAQIDEAIGSDTPARGPSLYRKVLISKYGAPGRAIVAHQAPDTSAWPADLGGEWVQPIAKLRDRIKQAFDAVDYRSWLQDLRFTGFEDGELTVWTPTGFKRDHIARNYEFKLATVACAVCPQVRRIVLVSGSQSLRRTG